jgi:hypothetical protein
MIFVCSFMPLVFNGLFKLDMLVSVINTQHLLQKAYPEAVSMLLFIALPGPFLCKCGSGFFLFLFCHNYTSYRDTFKNYTISEAEFQVLTESQRIMEIKNQIICKNIVRILFG